MEIQMLTILPITLFGITLSNQKQQLAIDKLIEVDKDRGRVSDSNIKSLFSSLNAALILAKEE